MWITELFEDKTGVTELKLIPASVFTDRVKHEIHEPFQDCLHVPHRCDATVFGEASHHLQTDCATPGLPLLNEKFEPQIRTVNLEPGVVTTPAVGAHIGPDYRVFASGHIARQTEMLQRLLKFKSCK